MKRTIRSNASLLAFLCLLWCLCGFVIWWAYDTKALINGGYYRESEAFFLVAKMGLIITVLVGIVWLLVLRRVAAERAWRLAWNVAWKTALVLLAYALIVVARRQFWTPSQGLGDSPMFLPLVGHVNGAFFSEFRWLSFVFVVVPIVGSFSGLLFSLHVSVLRGGWVTLPHHPNERS